MSGEQFLYNRPLPGARLNMAHPLTKGLVGCWLLNEQMGLMARDLSPYGNHGTLVGFPPGGQRAFNGLLFDGVDDKIDIPSVASVKPANFTLEAWLYFPSVPAVNMFPAGKQRNAAGYGSYLLSYFAADDQIASYISNSADTQVRANSATGRLIAGAWACWIGTYDSVNLKLYLDGQLAATTATTITIDQTDSFPFSIGNGVASQWFLGRAGLVRLYDWVLSAQDISALYISPYAPYGERMFL